MEENILNTDLGRKVLALSKACFKASDLMTDLVLREKIKQQTLVVYKTFFEKKYHDLIKEIDVLDSLFHLAGHIGLGNPEHLKLLKNGLLVFKSHVILNVHQKPRQAVEITEASAPVPAFKQQKNSAAKLTVRTAVIGSRQEKILNRFSNKETRLQLADFTELLPELSEKTIRNDLVFLMERGKISRQGRGSGSFYQLL